MISTKIKALLAVETCSGADRHRQEQLLKIEMIDKLIEEGHAKINVIDLNDNLVRYELELCIDTSKLID